ncbi:39S ribosomal protein L42, mitochondrial isoform X2 [Melanotaenia boesemani]|uniref:39S ribosomal protein L42, mitochondrial isoform X2 n=1 Tax=Melanotaenia boesemani TaxID=1250792 RepID=UPI001C0421B3|nr:39S ribosomal protein L42, mitochondrial isoform X2 [Melanotaenia boesemani]
MASGHLSRLSGLLTQIYCRITPRYAQTCLVPVRQKSGVDASSVEGPNCTVEIGVTSDEKTIVCYHPAADVPYELTQPIERPDPLTTPAETHDQVLKAHLSKEVLKDKEGPTIEELSKMFFTTKHRFYPVGQYHKRRIKNNPPKDR